MKMISIDIETFGDADLSQVGVYRYAEDPSFRLLLFGYAVDGGQVQCVDVARGEQIPEEVIAALQDPSILKYAFNAVFERICLGQYLGIKLDPAGWRCTMVHALYLGLPGSLAAVGDVLMLDKQKMSEGADLIRYFSIPCKPTKANGGRSRNGPEDDRGKWETYIRYNIRDVETEMAISEKLKRFPVPDAVWEQYTLDQHHPG